MPRIVTTWCSLALSVFAVGSLPAQWTPRGGDCPNSTGVSATLYPGTHLRAGNPELLLLADDLPAGTPTIAIIGASSIPVSGVYLGPCELTIAGPVATAVMTPGPASGSVEYSVPLPASSVGMYIGFQVAYVDPQTSELLLTNGLDVVVEPEIDWSQVPGGSNSTTPTGTSGMFPEHTHLIQEPLLGGGMWIEHAAVKSHFVMKRIVNLPGNDLRAFAGIFFQAHPTWMSGTGTIYTHRDFIGAAADARAKQVYRREFEYVLGSGSSIEAANPIAKSTGIETIRGVGRVTGCSASLILDASYTTEIVPLIPETTVALSLHGATATGQSVTIGNQTIPLPAWGSIPVAKADVDDLDSIWTPTSSVIIKVKANITYSLASGGLFCLTSSKSNCDLEGSVQSHIILGDDPQ